MSSLHVTAIVNKALTSTLTSTSQGASARSPSLVFSANGDLAEALLAELQQIAVEESLFFFLKSGVCVCLDCAAPAAIGADTSDCCCKVLCGTIHYVTKRSPQRCTLKCLFAF